MNLEGNQNQPQQRDEDVPILITLFNRTFADYNTRLVPVNENTDIVNIDGFICKPEFSKKSRGEQFIFVNNRYIKSAYLNHAVSNSMEGLLQADHFAAFSLSESRPWGPVETQ